uniref:Large subunit ribosomal protein L9e n=1 Tax=Tetraselmis sp. GSL018 TaxID=582737 RepID=A0A061SHM3_9CHLO|mmetsp:Transcript_41288/g.97938  ORF Transcript_41288/g.97938 Transcript_41288/m.97938 type:complete len:194 (+) Transcript_41288:85-666(+)|eukprot:CAMPEP_0177578766 /NCGR_PEP_ID=MMETSP0419_2-20121207/540_1 /TAXON_ID=582737 /ORGANISM="Tetraselmis sp., Strain GSL018" /LENGTH=193 /DNA_ID=CAMNT_0019067265 /DNA_START=80 /DNA_END=661 /DNA_ORIENTATION=-
MVKHRLLREILKVPEEVSIEVKARQVRVKGPRGTLSRDFRHTKVDIYLQKNEDGETTVVVDKHFGAGKQLAAIRTTISHIRNMIKGVTKGFCYKMRLVYAHFPINANIVGNGTCIELRNFLGEKQVRKISMIEGVKISRSTDVKDELVLVGNNVEDVSRSAALITQSCLVKHKDIRKFLDGIYVSERGILAEE